LSLGVVLAIAAGAVFLLRLEETEDVSAPAPPGGCDECRAHFEALGYSQPAGPGFPAAYAELAESDSSFRLALVESLAWCKAERSRTCAYEVLARINSERALGDITERFLVLRDDLPAARTRAIGLLLWGKWLGSSASDEMLLDVLPAVMPAEWDWRRVLERTASRELSASLRAEDRRPAVRRVTRARRLLRLLRPATDPLMGAENPDLAVEEAP
jgi:hypothetical protein